MTYERTANFTGLDQVDIELIQKQGAPTTIREDLILRTPTSQSISLSDYGRLFYSAACTHWGVPLATRIDSELAVLELNCALILAVYKKGLERLNSELLAGKLEPDVAAYASRHIYGDPEHYKTLMKQAA